MSVKMRETESLNGRLMPDVGYCAVSTISSAPARIEIVHGRFPARSSV
jgi:hypothetical protein